MREGQFINQLMLLSPAKQGILVIIFSGLLFFSMLVMNGNYLWTYSPPQNCIDSIIRCHGVVGLGLNMAEWAIISFVGVAIGLVRIFVINTKHTNRIE